MLGLGRGCFRLVLSETTFRIPLRSLPVGGRNLRERERERYYVATTLRDASESVRSEPISTMLILLLDPGDFYARGLTSTSRAAMSPAFRPIDHRDWGL